MKKKFGKALHTFLTYFAKVRRPFAWFGLVFGIGTFIVTIFDIVRTGDAKMVTLGGAVLLVLEAYDFVSEVETEHDSPAGKD